jgi:hypothetical protein
MTEELIQPIEIIVYKYKIYDSQKAAIQRYRDKNHSSS